MEYEIDKLRREFERKVAELQKRCPHKETEWLPYMWAPGHIWGEVLRCRNCGKILERKEPKLTSGSSSKKFTGTVIYK